MPKPQKFSSNWCGMTQKESKGGGVRIYIKKARNDLKKASNKYKKGNHLPT